MCRNWLFHCNYGTFTRYIKQSGSRNRTYVTAMICFLLKILSSNQRELFFLWENEVYRAVYIQILILWVMISCSSLGSYRYLRGLRTLCPSLWYGVESACPFETPQTNHQTVESQRRRLCYCIFSVLTLRPNSPIPVPSTILSPPYLMKISSPIFFCRNLSVQEQGNLIKTLCHGWDVFGGFLTTKDTVCLPLNLVDKIAPVTSSFS